MVVVGVRMRGIVGSCSALLARKAMFARARGIAGVARGPCVEKEGG